VTHIMGPNPGPRFRAQNSPPRDSGIHRTRSHFRHQRTPKIEDVLWSGSSWLGPLGAAQTPKFLMAFGRCPAGSWAARGRQDTQNQDFASSGSGWPRPPAAAQTPQIEDVVRSGSGWLAGRPGPPRTPQSMMSLGRGPAGLGCPVLPRPPKSKMSFGRGPAGLGRPGRPPNRRWRLVGVRLASKPPRTAHTPKIEVVG
jgi:hypothetical protein